jgi:hypothetical protein
VLTHAYFVSSSSEGMVSPTAVLCSGWLEFVQALFGCQVL